LKVFQAIIAERNIYRRRIRNKARAFFLDLEQPLKKI
jgi:hypothetical protein